MGFHVCSGAVLMCSFGMAPSKFTATPKTVKTGNQDAGNIMDHVPNMNIAPFGMCQSLANPQVASATAAALGVLTPMPCVPATVSPWAPGVPTILVANQPALNDSSILNCMWAGVIQVKFAGQVTEQVP